MKRLYRPIVSKWQVNLVCYSRTQYRYISTTLDLDLNSWALVLKLNLRLNHLCQWGSTSEEQSVSLASTGWNRLPRAGLIESRDRQFHSYLKWRSCSKHLRAVNFRQQLWQCASKRFLDRLNIHFFTTVQCSIVWLSFTEFDLYC